ncbi:MAG: hypothetical protein HY426_04840 [Candidatus Levybacteria bacterium]|nr:hypothetical protein [Candidatus Levybacteria bacterium]
MGGAGRGPKEYDALASLFGVKPLSKDIEAMKADATLRKQEYLETHGKGTRASKADIAARMADQDRRFLGLSKSELTPEWREYGNNRREHISRLRSSEAER